MDDAHGFHCFDMQLEQCQMVVCKFIVAVQYMHVLVMTVSSNLHHCLPSHDLVLS